MKMTFIEFLQEGRFPGAPKRGSEMRASQSNDDDEPNVRAKRNKKNLPDERSKYHPQNRDAKNWKSNRKTQYK